MPLGYVNRIDEYAGQRASARSALYSTEYCPWMALQARGRNRTFAYVCAFHWCSLSSKNRQRPQ